MHWETLFYWSNLSALCPRHLEFRIFSYKKKITIIIIKITKESRIVSNESCILKRIISVCFFFVLNILHPHRLNKSCPKGGVLDGYGRPFSLKPTSLAAPYSLSSYIQLVGAWYIPRLRQIVYYESIVTKYLINWQTRVKSLFWN